MQANQAQLVAMLEGTKQFNVPIYQRPYSWTVKQCDQLLSDIVRVGTKRPQGGHFLGSIVHISDSGLAAGITQFTVIDGQQRLTSVTILLIAIRDILREHADPTADISPDEIQNLLVNQFKKNDEFIKLRPTATDRQSYDDLIRGIHQDIAPANRISENYRFFRRKIDESGTDPNDVYMGIKLLNVVDVALKHGYDDAQLIFESLNSTGLSLTQSDLIRNFVLMGVHPADQQEMYETVWRPMEQMFPLSSYSTEFDAFMRHFLTVHLGEIPKIGEVYNAFKNWIISNSLDRTAIANQLSVYADYYTRIFLEREPDPQLRTAFRDLVRLDATVTAPFMLEIYRDYASGQLLTKQELLHVVHLVEGYLIRRTICSVPTNTLNSTFASFFKSVEKHRYVESIEARFVMMGGNQRFPTDAEVEQIWPERDLYSTPKRLRFILERLNNWGYNETNSMDSLSIEHILPQGIPLPQWWAEALGNNAQEIRDKYVHTIGNLTLTGYNAELSNQSYLKKRELPGGFRESAVRLNKFLVDKDSWGEKEILERAQHLWQRAKNIWAFPELSEEALNRYRQQPASSTAVPISVHKHLAGELYDLWQEIRPAILSLSPTVTEENYLSYIAYKAGTNFADIVPQASGLLIYLNLPYEQLEDPEAWCEDVTNVGTAGNGDARFRLRPTGNLDYALDLIEQAYRYRIRT